jgi:hypothetical protein
MSENIADLFAEYEFEEIVAGAARRADDASTLADDVAPARQRFVGLGIDADAAGAETDDITLFNMLTGDKWSYMPQRVTAARLIKIKDTDSVVRASAYLSSVVGDAMIPMVFLRNLRYMGIIYSHLENECHVLSRGHSVAATRICIVKCIVERLSDAEAPDMCLTVMLVLKQSMELDDATDTTGARELAQAYAQRAVLEKHTTLYSTARIADPVSGAGAGLAAKSEALAAHKRTCAEMHAQLEVPSTFVNFFYIEENVKDYEETYSIQL